MTTTESKTAEERTTSRPLLRRRRKRKTGLKRREARLAYVLLAPTVAIVIALVLFPFVWNAALSLQRVRLIDLQTVNLLDFDATTENFRRVTESRDFGDVLRTTFVYTIVGTVLSIAMGLWAALVMQKAFIGRSVVRGIMLFPYVAPVIAVTFAWRLMLNPTFGVANEWLDQAGFQRVDFLGRRDFVLNLGFAEVTLPLALTTVIVFEAWRYFPFAYLFILARLQAIPHELEEAALVDGATPSQRFRYVVLPELRAVLAVLFLLRFIWTFNKFDDIFLLTGGAAGTQVMTTKIFDWLFGRSDVGSAAALSLILAGILVVLVAVYFWCCYEEEEEET